VQKGRRGDSGVLALGSNKLVIELCLGPFLPISIPVGSLPFKSFANVRI
jgi:hypothetical protein